MTTQWGGGIVRQWERLNVIQEGSGGTFIQAISYSTTESLQIFQCPYFFLHSLKIFVQHYGKVSFFSAFFFSSSFINNIRIVLWKSFHFGLFCVFPTAAHSFLFLRHEGKYSVLITLPYRSFFHSLDIFKLYIYLLITTFTSCYRLRSRYIGNTTFT